MAGPSSQSFARQEQARCQASSQHKAAWRRDDDSEPRRRQVPRRGARHDFESLAERVKQVQHHLRIGLDPLVQRRCRRDQQRAMGPRSKTKVTSRRFLQDADLADRFALPYRAEPLFPSAGIGQKGVEFAFDQDPKLGNLVTGRRQRLTRHERSHANVAGDGCKLFGIQAFTKPNRPQPSHHALGIRC